MPLRWLWVDLAVALELAEADVLAPGAVPAPAAHPTRLEVGFI